MNTPYQVKGYASVFNVIDHHGDVMVPGAYEKTLKNPRGTHNKPMPLLWHHNTRFPIGELTLLKEDARGLYVEGHVIPGTRLADECILLLKSGLVSGLSVGYKLGHSKRTKNTTFVTSVDLFEVSLVTFPACEDARIGV